MTRQHVDSKSTVANVPWLRMRGPRQQARGSRSLLRPLRTAMLQPSLILQIAPRETRGKLPIEIGTNVDSKMMEETIIEDGRRQGTSRPRKDSNGALGTRPRVPLTASTAQTAGPPHTRRMARDLED